MAELALQRSKRPEILSLAERIRTSQNREALRTAPDFDRAFLEQMIAHHHMGVMMASHAQWGTVHPELRELEAAMVRVQSEEIEQMARWYQQWYGTGGSG
ncbi:MAG: DUF305 domain-containing protein [Synechococcus sp.]